MKNFNKKSYALLHLIRQYLPDRPVGIVEIGVYRGENAKYLLKNLVKDNVEVSYYGFDLFEDAKDAGVDKTNPGVYNNTIAKGRLKEMSLPYVKKSLKSITPNVFLTKGDSNITVSQMASKIKTCNFFYIDGGHDYISVKRDWINVSKIAGPGSLIVFDDALTSGIREVIDEIEESGVVVQSSPYSRKFIIKE